MSDDAIPAATLIVVRERAGGPPELLMVERAGGMAFAAGALVFPGGRVDEADRRLGDSLGVDPHAIAAIRETIEETAIPVGLRPIPDPEHSALLQRQLVADRPLADALSEVCCAVDSGSLTPFARWVPKFTPSAGSTRSFSLPGRPTEIGSRRSSRASARAPSGLPPMTS